jgi:hypothetical protein
MVVAVAAACGHGSSALPQPGTPAPAATDAAQAPATTRMPPPLAASPTDNPAIVIPPSPPADVPVAFLVVDGERHPGEIGGYVFGRETSSAPWLPATAVEQVTIPAGADIRVELDDRATIAEWRARYAAADDRTGDALTSLGEATSPTVEFDAPPTGAWVASVVITYGGGLGDGAYYWHLVVE